MESTFGIKHYLSNNPGFSGIIKHRYSDFIVHEIDESGNFVVLTDLKAKSNAEDLPTLPQQNSFTFSPETLEQLQKLQSSELTEIFIDCQNSDKAERTKIHETIRQQFTKLESCAITNDGVTKIKVTRNANAAQRNRKRAFWPSDRGDFCQFVLYKENRDSGSATAVVAKFLNLRQIGIAGTKDRRAITSQLATAYKIEAEKVAKLNDTLIGIRLGNFSYVSKEMRLGALNGNRFTIVLRNVDASPDIVENNVRHLKEKGFINYYGTQRFGTSSISTHSVGKAIIQKKWSDAVDLLLSKRDKPFAYVENCYDIWTTTKDPSLALASIPPAKRDTCIEGILLKALKKNNSTDFSSAIRAIPRNSRNLYVHSFQSLVWNKLVSKRVSTLSDKLLVGDLVLNDVEFKEEFGEESNVKILAEDDLQNYNIFDMVLPLFSTEECLPKNQVSDWYRELLDEENVTWEQIKSCSKEYALHGGYRRMLMKPDKLEYELIRYNNPDDPLTLSDLDLIEGKAEPNSCIDGKYLALKLEFSLPPGCYATMVLRELTKSDSSKGFQTTLNDYAKSSEEEEKEIVLIN